MTQRFVETDHDRDMLVRFIEGHELPMTVTMTTGGRRTAKQNRLNRLWVNEIAAQMDGWTPEDVRAYCKLTIGVPLLRAENEEFREKYDQVVRPLPYEQKMTLMREPLDFPVTRLMTTKQQTKYMDDLYKHFSEKGIVLTMPEDNSNPGATVPSAARTDEAPSPASSEPVATAASPAAGFSIPDEDMVMLKEFARSAMDIATELNAPLESKNTAYRARSLKLRSNLQSYDSRDVLTAILKPFTAVVEGKRTPEQARDYIARDLLDCDPAEIGGGA